VRFDHHPVQTFRVAGCFGGCNLRFDHLDRFTFDEDWYIHREQNASTTEAVDSRSVRNDMKCVSTDLKQVTTDTEMSAKPHET
jgi:hypothetical protein